MNFRKIIFWFHLAAGVIAGLVILVMSITGAALAFEKEIIAWIERDVRRVAAPAPDAVRLSVDELLARVRAVQPDARPSTLTIYADPSIAALASFGRTNGLCVNPYDGTVQSQGAQATRAFMQTMIEWHRYLGARDAKRPIGKAITGACNAAFCFLAISGLYLWWPRQWTKNVLRGVLLFNLGLRGKARDWNWHNVIGVWCAPVLIVLTATAMPISYRWAGDLIYKLTRSEPPAPNTSPGGTPALFVAKPSPDAEPLALSALVAAAQKHAPNWEQIILRPGGGGGPRGAASRESEPRPPRNGTPPITIAIKERKGAPRFATKQLTFDPFTGALLREETYAGYNLGRKVRSWTRFLHTGEALGPAGQAAAGLASLAGGLLVWTGLALAWRRFFLRKQRTQSDGSVASQAASEVGQ